MNLPLTSALLSIGLTAAGVCTAPETPPANQQAAFGVESIKLGGLFGHRIDTMIKGNLLKIDVEKDHLSFFRDRKLGAGFRGTGLLLDGTVHLAACSPDQEVVDRKNHWIDELISTQDPGGYIGILRPDVPDRGSVNYDLSERGTILLALVNDYRFLAGRNPSRRPRNWGITSSPTSKRSSFRSSTPASIR